MLAAVQRLVEHEALGEPFLAEVLRSLVQTPSVNPEMTEDAVASVVEGWLADLPMEVRRVEFAPGRASVGARLQGAAEGPALVLNGHLDTVPIDDRRRWSTDPFGGEVRGGFVYGRGSVDMKGGLAVAIAVAHVMADTRDRMAGSLVLHFAAGEERGEPGTLSLLDAGFTGDYGITLEPTDLNVATATRGAAFMRLRITGQSVHASRAAFGVNPIAQLAPVLQMLAAYDRELAQRDHPLLPGGSITPTTLVSGVKENAVPDDLVLTIDRRLLPEEDPEEDLAELRRRLEGLKGEMPDFRFELEHMFPALAGAEIPTDAPLARLMVDAAAAVTGRTPEIYGSPFGSDVRNLVGDAGIQALTFGPGDVTEAHSVDERIELRQMHQAAVAVALAAERLLVTGSDAAQSATDTPGERRETTSRGASDVSGRSQAVKRNRGEEEFDAHLAAEPQHPR
jgi:succinyl-diaminopimelate desuccinylase